MWGHIKIAGEFLDFFSVLFRSQPRLKVFRDEKTERDFIANISSLIRKGSHRIDVHITSQVKSNREIFTTHDISEIAEAVVRELLTHESEVQEGVFSALNMLPDRALYDTLFAIMSGQGSGAVLSRALRSAAALQNPFLRIMLIRKAARRIKKGIQGKNKQERLHMLALVEDLPSAYRRKIYRYIFRSAFSFHNVQLAAVKQLESLSESERLFFSERIVRLKDADEKLIIETLGMLPGVSSENQRRFLTMMFKNAPYDSVALRLAGAMQQMPDVSKDRTLYRMAFRVIRRGVNLDDDEMRIYAVSLISQFPLLYKKRLLLRAFQSDFVDSRLNALKHLVLLPENMRFDLLQMVIQSGDPDDPEKRLLSGAIRMIAFVQGKNREDLVDLAVVKLLEIFETIRKDTYRFESLRLIPVMDMLPHFPPELVEAARAAMTAVLNDSKRSRQLLAVNVLVHCPIHGKDRMFLEGLKSEYEDVILALKNTMRYFPEEIRNTLMPYYMERLVQKRIQEE
jgi:hypothetical protein